MFGSIDELCQMLAAMPGAPHSPGNPTSANDEAWICLTEQAAGKTLTQIVACVVTRGGAVGVGAWLLFITTPQDTDDGSPPWYPPQPPPGGSLPYNPNPPSTLPAPWDAPIAAAAQRLRGLNPALALDDATVTELARRCVWIAAQAKRSLSECGQRGLPIFVIGREAPEATDHILQALQYHAPWFRLTYKDTLRTSWYQNYPETEPGGAPQCKGTGMITACDEFPCRPQSKAGNRQLRYRS